MSCCCSPKQSSPGPSLAIATIPMQPWEEPYDACQGLKTGTIFPGLDLPFYVTAGGEHHG